MSRHVQVYFYLSAASCEQPCAGLTTVPGGGRSVAEEWDNPSIDKICSSDKQSPRYPVSLECAFCIINPLVLRVNLAMACVLSNQQLHRHVSHSDTVQEG